MDSEVCLATAVTVAREVGETILDFYRAELVVDIKGGDTRNLVTDADLEADRRIGLALRAAFPDHAILSEEGLQPDAAVDDEVPTWVVDPIDGTSNFAHRLPFFAVSIGLHYQGAIQVGVVHAPALAWTFTAARGRGAALNGLPLQVSRRSLIREGIAACDWSRQPALRRLVLAGHAAIAEEAHTMRSMGSAALGFAAVAAGWLDIYFNYSLYPWDTAAGSLLVQEAGGMVTTLDGSPWQAMSRSVLVSNGSLHPAALALLAPHLPEPNA